MSSRLHRPRGMGFLPPRTAVCACWLLAAASGNAQSVVELSALEDCAGIADNMIRLACYDAVTDAARTASEVAPPSAGGPQDSAAPTPSSTRGIDAFGVEQVDGRGAEIPDEIQSRFIGTFMGWRGDTVFRLENGQVWRQTEQDRLVFQADAPLVTIRRGSFGSYRLSVEGVNSSVRVRRVE